MFFIFLLDVYDCFMHLINDGFSFMFYVMNFFDIVIFEGELFFRGSVEEGAVVGMFVVFIG